MVRPASRQAGNDAPVLFLTAKDAVEDRTEPGADERGQGGQVGRDAG